MIEFLAGIATGAGLATLAYRAWCWWDFRRRRHALVAALAGLKQEIGAAVLPSVQALSVDLNDWIVANGDELRGPGNDRR